MLTAILASADSAHDMYTEKGKGEKERGEYLGLLSLS